MEKLKPTYDLASIQAEFSTVDGLRMTVTARNSAFARVPRPHEEAVLYVKFTVDAEGHLVISLKEK